MTEFTLFMFGFCLARTEIIVISNWYSRLLSAIPYICFSSICLSLFGSSLFFLLFFFFGLVSAWCLGLLFHVF
jgi:hypothetical protein